jgi:hypothetical protein
VGTSVRRLAKDFGTTQWMVEKLTEPGAVAASESYSFLDASLGLNQVVQNQ